MKVRLCLGGVVLDMTLAREVTVDEGLYPFIAAETEKTDVSITVSWEWDRRPRGEKTFLGRCDLLEYFGNNDGRRAFAVADGNVYQACTEYEPGCSTMSCFINEEKCHPENMNLGTILRFLPMREVFHQYGVLFFHASQIVYRGKGILFTAPSGTGKTTQAKFWRDRRGAEIRCNDRTLLRRTGNHWETFGYPLDGSEPVRSPESAPLGCIVLLKQGKTNEIQRLSAVKAAASLMEQLVLDGWNGDATAKAAQMLMDIWCEVPIYQLVCTLEPSVNELDSVECLERKLVEDGIL